MAKEGSAAWKRDMDAIVKKWTGWDSLDHMCRNNPTLVITPHTSDAEKKAITKMREAYKYMTGKQAHPQSDKWRGL